LPGHNRKVFLFHLFEKVYPLTRHIPAHIFEGMKRSTLILNVASLLSIIICFELHQIQGWEPVLLIYALIPAIVLVISYIKLNHYRNEIIKTEKAYSLFSIVVVIILMVWHLLSLKLNMILIISILYFAYALPLYLNIWMGTRKT